MWVVIKLIQADIASACIGIERSSKEKTCVAQRSDERSIVL